MEAKILKCRQCGAPIQYMQGENHVKCVYCGTEYVMQQNSNRQIRDINYMNQGTLFRAYIPEGWQYRVFDDEKNFSMLAAVCRGLCLNADNGSKLMFYPFAYYKNFNPDGIMGSGISIWKNYQLEGMTLMRYRHLPELEMYMKECLKEVVPDARYLALQPVDDLDDFLREKTNQFIQASHQKIRGQVAPIYAKYKIAFEMGTEQYEALVAVSLAVSEKCQAQQDDSKQEEPAEERTKTKLKGFGDFLKFGMSGGLIGAKKRGELESVKMPSLDSITSGKYADWGKCFACIMISNAKRMEIDNRIFNSFCKHLQYGDLYFALQEEELRNVERIQLQGMQERSRNAFQASQRLRQTQNETSDIIYSGYAQRSAAMDRIYQKQSEAVRGVNSYQATDGRRVEADVRYEHVYQKGDTFAESNASLDDIGPDWVELKRK